MTASKAGLVNQQFYHAKLLLQMQQQLPNGPEFLAQNLALENAVYQSLLLALQGFLQELAASCQLPVLPTSVKELEQLMAEQGKLHPTLQALQQLQQQNSWLQQLQAITKTLLTRTASTLSPSHSSLLAVASVEQEPCSLASLLEQFQQFVQNQREYLQEY